MIEKEVHKGDILDLNDKDGKAIGRVTAITVTEYRIYTNKGTFLLDGREVDGERTLSKCTPEIKQNSGIDE